MEKKLVFLGILLLCVNAAGLQFTPAFCDLTINGSTTDRFEFKSHGNVTEYWIQLNSSGGGAIVGSNAVTVACWDSVSAGSLLWNETQTIVFESEGNRVLLGNVTGINFTSDVSLLSEDSVLLNGTSEAGLDVNQSSFWDGYDTPSNINVGLLLNNVGFFSNLSNISTELTNNKWCRWRTANNLTCDVDPVSDTDTNTLYYNSSFNTSEIPNGAGYFNDTTNITNFGWFENKTLSSYRNISGFPTCSATEYWRYDGTDVLCSVPAASTDTDTNVTSIQFTGTTTKTLNLEQTGSANLTATFTDSDTLYSNGSFRTSAIPNDAGFFNSTSNFTGEKWLMNTPYLYNDTTTAYFNESKMNKTVVGLVNNSGWRYNISVDSSQEAVNASFLEGVSKADLNVNSSNFWDNLDTPSDLNTNSSNYWDGLDTPNSQWGKGNSSLEFRAGINITGYHYNMSVDSANEAENASYLGGHAWSSQWGKGNSSLEFIAGINVSGYHYNISVDSCIESVNASFLNGVSMANLNGNSSNYWDGLDTPNAQWGRGNTSLEHIASINVSGYGFDINVNSSGNATVAFDLSCTNCIGSTEIAELADADISNTLTCSALTGTFNGQDSGYYLNTSTPFSYWTNKTLTSYLNITDWNLGLNQTLNMTTTVLKGNSSGVTCAACLKMGQTVDNSSAVGLGGNLSLSIGNSLRLNGSAAETNYIYVNESNGRLTIVGTGTKIIL